MDFLVICQGLGLALAAGLIVGVVLPPIMPTWGYVAGAAPLGIGGCVAALSSEGEPLWPAVPIGVLAAGLAAVVARDIARGAARRERGGAGPDPVDAQVPAAITGIFVLAGAVLALLSLFVPPVSLVALAALAWLWLSRRRRAERKHEGLRVLR
jgi:uncharacterized protein (TIGR03382 family)